MQTDIFARERAEADGAGNATVASRVALERVRNHLAERIDDAYTKQDSWDFQVTADAYLLVDDKWWEQVRPVSA